MFMISGLHNRNTSSRGTTEAEDTVTRPGW